MQKIPISLAREGMVLAKPILKDNGMVLVADGSELSTSLLDRLASLGVDKVVVKGSPVDMDGMSGAAHADRIGRMDHLFRKHVDDPWMMKLSAFLKHYFQLKAAAEAAAKAEEEAAREAEEQPSDRETDGE